MPVPQPASRSSLRHLGLLLLALSAATCSDGPTSPTDLQLLEGTWVNFSTDHPELLPVGTIRCVAFRPDSTYVWDDVFPATSQTAIVPSAVHRWQGRTTLRNDTLTRWMDTDDLYTGFDGVTLLSYWQHDSMGGIVTPIRLETGRMTLTLDTWVQGVGYLTVTDDYRRGRTEECAQPYPGITR